MKCHLIDSLPQPGGQCVEIYPKKPIYDIPAFPKILAGDLVTNLMTQIAPFKPGFTLGERVEVIEKKQDGSFYVTTNLGTIHQAKVVVVAAGLGCFEPRKPIIDNLSFFENNGVDYIIKDPEKQERAKRKEKQDNQLNISGVNIRLSSFVFNTYNIIHVIAIFAE